MRRIFVGLVALLVVLGIAGCGGEDPAGGVQEAETTGSDARADASADASREVLVLGRSVMTGWMEHWGGDASDAASWEGYTITFREIEGPPGIATSAADAISQADAGSTVLFKFCFVDFNGGEYDDELDTYMEYVTEVADAADAAGVRLILGTALPKVEGENTPELVDEHREFARRVEELAAERRDAGQDVVVLDLNAVLSDGEGALEKGYAVSSDDSHLKGAAYDALDVELLKLLGDRD
ncbi:MAG: hypothetical protein JXA36_04990 [Coriobacteriia bacterium]|nr:hypothetical protein [Coriobacteriia bacterium]